MENEEQTSYAPYRIKPRLCAYYDHRFYTDKPRLILAERCEHLIEASGLMNSYSSLCELRSLLGFMTDSDSMYIFLFDDPSSLIASENNQPMDIWKLVRRLSRLILHDLGCPITHPERSLENLLNAYTRIEYEVEHMRLR
jgi:hypothetical protein